MTQPVQHQDVQEYYGKTLEKSQDLKTNACCTIGDFPQYISKALSNVHDEVKTKYYGCGLVIPPAVENLNVLDLGSGSGRDCYILSQLVGPKGKVTGVDMTPEQLAVANKYLDYHADKWGHSNVRFFEGNIENLEQLSLPPSSFDLIISNCVINLAHNKFNVLKQAYDLLAPGGEMYFSDVYADRRVPDSLRSDKVLYGECLSGALYWNDFIHLAKRVGFVDPRKVDDTPITINNTEVARKIGPINFFSVTYRLFKIPLLENDCEDYGQALAYKGGLPECPQVFKLDDHHLFEVGKIEKVCGNTYRMLSQTRFKEFFEFYGDFSMHHGIFPGCGKDMPFEKEAGVTANNCC